MEGDIEKTEHTIKITEIRVTYHLPMPSDKLETAQRVLKIHPKGCPAHETVKDVIRFKLEAEFKPT